MQYSHETVEYTIFDTDVRYRTRSKTRGGVMEAMSEAPDHNSDTGRMSMRNSLLVWVFGAVLGWVVAVVAIYTVIRTADEPLIARDALEKEEKEVPRLERIEPASGGAGSDDFKAAPMIRDGN